MTDADETTITAINFEDARIERLAPERHVFMGCTYFYGRIVSIFGKNGGKGLKKMMKYMVFSGMLKGDGNGILLVLRPVRFGKRQ